MVKTLDRENQNQAFFRHLGKNSAPKELSFFKQNSAFSSKTQLEMSKTQIFGSFPKLLFLSPYYYYIESAEMFKSPLSHGDSALKTKNSALKTKELSS